MTTNTSFNKMLDRVLPAMPPFLEMITLQAATMAEGFSVAVECLSEADEEKVAEMERIQARARELRQKHLDILHQSFSTPIDRIDLLQAINTLETPVEWMWMAVDEMRVLHIGADNYCLEMAVVLREAASALHRGYARLSTTPGLAVPDAQVGIQSLSSVDAVYHRALARLYSVESAVQGVPSEDAEVGVNAFERIVEILKRREEYQHLRNIASSVSDAAAVLNGIAVQIG